MTSLFAVMSPNVGSILDLGGGAHRLQGGVQALQAAAQWQAQCS